MKEKMWIYRNSDYDRDKILSDAKLYSISPVILTILYNRGITSERDISEFMSKSLQNVHNPYDLPDMEKAVDRIYDAVNNNEKIYIYGDYDVDGVTSSAMLYKYLVSHGADVSYYIPDRITEGYGMNVMAVNRISKSGCRLLVTVDCGITSTGETELAKAQGMDVIITDHHTCKEKLPEALAVINPKRSDSEYPFKELAGAGVTFKLILALAVKYGEPVKEIFFDYVMLAAIGTVADVVSLTGENRIIVDRGVAALAATKHAGIKALMRVAGINDASASSISFGIAPRLNAAGRLDNAVASVELLLCEDKTKADELAERLNAENNRRRAEEKKILDEAEKYIDASKKVIVVGGECWHSGVIGIVASRICEKYGKPTIVFSDSGGLSKGSCRSIEGFNIFDALSECDSVIEKFGGHAMAAGLTVKTENMKVFADKINKYAESKISDGMTVPKVNIDCKISVSSLTTENIKALSVLEPFGCDNEKPVFSICGVEVISAMQIGEGKSHLKLQVRKGDIGMSCIAFRMGEYYDEFTGRPIADIAFSPEINNYNGRENVQLLLHDIKLKSR